jgi:hypothetical protein
LSLAKAQIERHHKAKRKTKIDIQRETGGFLGAAVANA